MSNTLISMEAKLKLELGSQPTYPPLSIRGLYRARGEEKIWVIRIATGRNSGKLSQGRKNKAFGAGGDAPNGLENRDLAGEEIASTMGGSNGEHTGTISENPARPVSHTGCGERLLLS